MTAIPHFVTLHGLAAMAGVDRRTAQRQIAVGLLAPDAVVQLGDLKQPVFMPEKAISVLRNVQPPQFRPKVS